MTTVFLGMGSNLGNRQNSLDSAIEKLDVLTGNQLKKVSSIIENPPLTGGPEQGPFLNLVVELETVMKPLDLLRQIQKIENEGGRQRQVFWGPRTIDIDILFYGNEVINVPELKVPHPEMYKRDFVMMPLLELSPDLIDPKNGKLVRENWVKSKNLN
jgi:2-amino-4-hydroxy-6-hydroxymethyldihydropteridine diphosphokinase